MGGGRPQPSFQPSLVPWGRTRVGRLLIIQRPALVWAACESERLRCFEFSLFLFFLGCRCSEVIEQPQTTPRMNERSGLSSTWNSTGGFLGQKGLAQTCLHTFKGLGKGCRIPGSPPDFTTTSSSPVLPLLNVDLFPECSKPFLKAAMLCFCFAYYLWETTSTLPNNYLLALKLYSRLTSG